MYLLKEFSFKLILILAALIPSLILLIFFEPYKRGFFCDDESIRKPKLGTEIIPVGLLFAVVFVKPLFIFFFVNWFNHNYKHCEDKNHTCRSIFWQDVYNYFFCFFLMHIPVETSKLIIGRHRPNFYHSCEPRIQIITEKNVTKYVECNVLDIPEYSNYIENYICTKTTSFDIHQSFMSGHSAFAAFFAFYICFYLHKRLKDVLKDSLGRLIILFIIILEINLAFFIGLTRISDYKHHPTDVLIGLLTGTVTATFLYHYIDKVKCESSFRQIVQTVSKMQEIV